MGMLLQSHLLPCVFALAICTLLYVSWTYIMDSLCYSPLPRAADRFWEGPSLLPNLSDLSSTADPPDLTPIPVLRWKDYRRLPQWDFDDQYRSDRRPSKSSQKCDSSLWNIIDQDPELRDKFLPNIRLYVHNGSITMSEWNRLSHFNNPFGFMNYSYDDVMPALNLVPKPKSPLLPRKPGRDCITCAAVANGGVLWRSGKGAEIDGHDYVIRVNGAAVKGFEEDVGNRTDVYVHTAHSITTSEIVFKKHKYQRAPHDKGIKYVLIPEAIRDFKWIIGLYRTQRINTGSYKGRHPWHQYSGRFNESRFYVLHMDFLRYVRNRFLKSPTLNGTKWNIVRPTNGAFMMFLALQLCDKVDAYGFITDDHHKYSNYYFERGAKTHVIFYINHNYNMELKLWKKLHDLNIINLYQGEGRQAEPTAAQNGTWKGEGRQVEPAAARNGTRKGEGRQVEPAAARNGTRKGEGRQAEPTAAQNGTRKGEGRQVEPAAARNRTRKGEGRQAEPTTARNGTRKGEGRKTEPTAARSGTRKGEGRQAEPTTARNGTRKGEGRQTEPTAARSGRLKGKGRQAEPTAAHNGTV